MKRVQRKRIRDWRMPENTIYVGRPSKWGNPYAVMYQGLTVSLMLFRKHVNARPNLLKDIRKELKDKDLACWCPLDKPCHADILLELANSK